MKFIVFAFGIEAPGPSGEQSCSLELIRDIVKPWLSEKGFSVTNIAKVPRSTLVGCVGKVDALGLPNLTAEFKRYIVEKYLKDNTGMNKRAGYPTIYLDRSELRAVISHTSAGEDERFFNTVVSREIRD